MPTTSNPLALYHVAENLLECASNALATTPNGTVDRRCVTTGEVAWDDCECGQLIVSIRRSYASSNFPTEGNSPPASQGDRGCGPPIHVVEYLISILRCSPTGPDSAHPPSCEEIDEAAQVAVYDAWAVQWGVRCCLRDWTRTQDPAFKITDFTFRTHPFVGPAGACQGSELVVLVGLLNACPPCDQFQGES